MNRTSPHALFISLLACIYLCLPICAITCCCSYSLRVAVLRELDNVALDDFMVEAENLTLLFAALNEDTFDVRTIAISVLGRLMPHKPADVMPHLRTLLTELLTGAASLAAPYRIVVTPHTTTPLLHALPHTLHT